MVRETSLAAYKHLVENGTLSNRRRSVYSYLWLLGPATATQVGDWHGGDKTSSFRPRLAELERMGLIKTVGTETNPKTGVSNLLWDVTDLVEPIPLTRKQTKAEKIRAIEIELNKLHQWTGPIGGPGIDTIKSILQTL